MSFFSKADPSTGDLADDQPCTSRDANASGTRSRYSLPEALNELYLDSDSDDEDLNVEDEDDDFEPLPQRSRSLSDSDENSEDELTGTVSSSSRASNGGGISVGRMRRERKEFVLDMLGMDEKNWVNSSNRSPIVHPFTAKQGMLVDVCESSSLGYFKLFFDDFIIGHMVEQTNKYASDYISNPPKELKEYSRVHQWLPTNKSEMKTFLGLTMLMGIIRKPTVELYWSKDPLYHTPIFSQVMNRNRYQLLLKFFHLNDNDTMLPKSDPNYDRLHKLRPLLDHFSQKFQSVYQPGSHLSLDEAMVLWKGMLSFKQFIQSKRTRFGMKVFQLCEDNGYTYKFEVYTGSGMSEDSRWTKTENLVLNMVPSSLRGCGYELYTDNWYTTPHLLLHLHENKINACGTVRKNCTGFPKSVVSEKIERHQIVSKTNGPLLAIKYKDTKDVFFLTNFHDEQMVQVRKKGPSRNETMRNKPAAIDAYNRFMGGVDKTSQVCTVQYMWLLALIFSVRKKHLTLLYHYF